MRPLAPNVLATVAGPFQPKRLAFTNARASAVVASRIFDVVSSSWWPGPGGFYAESIADRRLLALYVNPTTLTAAPLDLQGYVPPIYPVAKPAWSATGELFLFVTGSDETGKAVAGILQVADGKVTASISIPAESLPADPNPQVPRTQVLLVGPQLLIVTTNGSGPKSVLRIPRP